MPTVNSVNNPASPRPHTTKRLSDFIAQPRPFLRLERQARVSGTAYARHVSSADVRLWPSRARRDPGTRPWVCERQRLGPTDGQQAAASLLLRLRGPDRIHTRKPLGLEPGSAVNRDQPQLTRTRV